MVDDAENRALVQRGEIAGDPELAGRVDALLHEGRFIEAIHVHRKGVGCSLKDAKDAITRRTTELGIPAEFGFWAVLRRLLRR